jgi:hypothetical protein
MRGWLPYWDLLAAALHVQGKGRSELAAAREARRRFPDRVAGYLPEARALAGQRKSNELEALWQVIRDHTHETDGQTGDLALEVGDELQAHGDSAASLSWYRRAYQEFASMDSTRGGETQRWGRAQAASRLGRWDEALHLGQALLSGDSTVFQYRGFTGVAAARLGRRAMAEALLLQLADDSRPYTLGHAQFEAARVAAALGQLGRANDLLVSAYTRGYPYDIDFHRDPFLKAIPGHRRFPG